MQKKRNVDWKTDKHYFFGWIMKLGWIIFLLLYSVDDITFELFHKYDIYTSLTIQELIEQGYDEDNSLLNSLSLHEEISQFIQESSYKLDSEKLTAIKDRKSRPIQASSVIDFSNDNYSYRIEIIHERGLIVNKNILISWSEENLFDIDDNTLDYILYKANMDIESYDIEYIFKNEYKKNWKAYNKDLGNIVVRMDNIDNKYVCFIGNEKKTNKINLYIDEFVSK